MKCPFCGQEHADSTKFCPETGNKIEVSSLTCPKCSFASIPADSRFCPNCGYQFEDIRSKGTKTPSCSECGSSNVTDDGSGYLQFKCETCGNVWGDEEVENRFYNKEKSYDNKGTPIRRYFEIFGVVVGEENGRKIKKLGTPHYENGEESEYWFDGAVVKINPHSNRIESISIDDDSDIPYFYQKKGIKWHKKYSEIKTTCESLGLTIQSELVGTGWCEGTKWLIVVSPESNRYKSSLQIEFEFNFDEYSDELIAIKWETI